MRIIYGYCDVCLVTDYYNTHVSADSNISEANYSASGDVIVY